MSWWYRPVSWFTRNAGTIAKIVIPTGVGIIGGMAIQQQLTGPTTGYNSGGAPITIVNPAPQSSASSDPFSGLMSSLPNMMMMMMMIPMMTSMMRQTSKKDDEEE